jgi:hypothetical protein
LSWQYLPKLVCAGFRTAIGSYVGIAIAAAAMRRSFRKAEAVLD